MAKESVKASSSDKAGPEKERALSAALAQIERQFGKGSMMRLGDKELGELHQLVHARAELRLGRLGHLRLEREEGLLFASQHQMRKRRQPSQRLRKTARN